MWLLLPIGSDRSVYGLPRFTVGAMAVCIAIYLLDVAGVIDPIAAFGYLPAEPASPAVVLHIFAHAGLMHLAFNMLFLWCMGVNVEQRWGAPAFGAVFLIGGSAAGMLFAMLHAGSRVPLVGASGAISAAMGAYLITLHRSRIRLWYLFLFRAGTFQIPAYLLLPCWFLLDLANMWMFESDAGGTAYSAHVGGFVVGALLAAALKLSGLEKRLLDRTGADAFDDPDQWSSLPTAPAPVPLVCVDCQLVNMPGAGACRRCGAERLEPA
jgi:membrane associated rhomboid family serine protease